MTPFVIPLFIAHQGCPHRCIFCNQYVIAGGAGDTGRRITAGDVEKEIIKQLSWPRKHPESEVQVAFYGGSFTGLPRERQEELLGAVQPFLNQGKVKVVRLSTRPDYINHETPAFLQNRGVGIVELGVQSMDSTVLAKSLRGHTDDHVESAFDILKQAGLKVAGQLMIGLPGETTAGLLAGARRLANLKPDFVRIYPTLVVRGSGLANLYKSGKYRPLSLNRAVALTAGLKRVFDRHGIRIVRMGLQPSSSLEENLLAGPYHPAFGELVLSRMMFKRTRDILSRIQGSEKKEISVSAADESIFRGQGNMNLNRLDSLGLMDGTRVLFDPKQPRNSVRRVNGKKWIL